MNHLGFGMNHEDLYRYSVPSGKVDYVYVSGYNEDPLHVGDDYNAIETYLGRISSHEDAHLLP